MRLRRNTIPLKSRRGGPPSVEDRRAQGASCGGAATAGAGALQPMAGESTSDAPRRVVIAGGGVAALEAMLALRARAGSRASATIVAPDPDFVYRPLSTGEPFALAEAARYPLARLADN